MRGIMNILERIREGESRELEFKQAVPEEAARYVRTAIAFANGFGGAIVFGISDDGEILGIPEDRISKDIETVSYVLGRYTRPSIPYDVRMLNLDGKLLIVAKVDEGRSKPYSSGFGDDKGAVYKRRGRNTFRANDDEIREMRVFSDPMGYDSLPYTSPDGDDELDEAQAGLLLDILRGNGADSTLATLSSYGLIKKRDDRFVPTRGFELLTRNRDRFCTMCFAYKGTEVGEIIDHQALEGSIIDQLNGMVRFVQRNIRCAAVIEGVRREDVYEIPMDAIREVACNAVMHRSYSIHANIQVNVFDDRVEVKSPGDLMIGRDELLVGWSYPRNRAICDFMRASGNAELGGNGFRKIWAGCRRMGLPEPTVDDSSGMTVVTLYKGRDRTVGRPSSGGGGLGTYEAKVLERIAENPEARLQDIADSLGISKVYVSKIVRSLKGLGLLARDESVRSGGWIVIGRGD